MPDINENIEQETICIGCYHHMIRNIKPFAETKEQWEEEFNIELDDDSTLETSTCLLLGLDLDHDVFACNKRISKDQVNFMNNIKLFQG